MTEYPNFIDGNWTGDDYTPNINPSDVTDVIGHYAQATVQDVDRAIAAAASARDNWADFPTGERARILDQVGTTILERTTELGTLLSREEGKTLREGVGEVKRAGQTFRYYAHQLTQSVGELYNSSRAGITIDVLRRPVGVVGVITPWNYPIAIPAWKIAPALAYGNAVVFKPADLVPGSAWMLAKIIHESGVPDGAFNLVMGQGNVVGQAIVEAEQVDAVTFTGSVGVGNKVAVDALTHGGKRFQTEMGGKSPLLIMDDADLETALQIAEDGSFYSTGQRCTASSRLIVSDGIHDQFVERLADRVSRLKVGSALDEATQIGPVASQKQLDTSLEYIKLGKAEGAEILAGGHTVATSTDGYFLEPTLFAGGSNSMRINQEEIFGPVSCVIKVSDFDEALTVANDTRYGLAAGIATTSLKVAHEFRRRIRAGIVAINQPTAGTDLHVPFGGVKGSSHGPREQGSYARDFYTTISTCYTSV